MAEKDIIVRCDPAVDAWRGISEEIKKVWPSVATGQTFVASHLFEWLYFKDKLARDEWRKVMDHCPLGLVHVLWVPERKELTFVIDTDDTEAVTIVQNILKRFGWEESP
jgi:hypothetical protein